MDDDDHIYHSIDGPRTSDVTPSRRRQPRQTSPCVTVVMATLAVCVAAGGCAALFFRLQQQQAEVDLLKSNTKAEVDLLKSNMKAEVLKVRIESELD